MAEALADPLRPHEEAVAVPDRFDAGVWFIGRIRTPWTRREDCPKRGDPLSGPLCRIEVFDPWVPALAGVEGHERLQVLYWMHLARRDAVRQNPRFADGSTGTFSLRSPLRPNPVASSIVRLAGVEGAVVTVRGLDCVDGTPLIDLKPEFGAIPCDIIVPSFAALLVALNRPLTGSGRHSSTKPGSASAGLARKMWRAPTEEPGGVLLETVTDRRRNFGVKRCGLR